MIKSQPLLTFLGGIWLSIGSLAQAQTYTQTFDEFPNGTQDLGDGTTIGGSVGGEPTDLASVQDGALQLTDDETGDMRGSFRIPHPSEDPSDGFRASFRFQVADSSGNPADGFSFTYGSIPAFDENQDVTGPQGHGGAEEGFGVGLSVEFDTYYNSAPEGGYAVAVNNVDVPGLFSVDRRVPVDGVFHTAEIIWYPVGTGGRLTLLVDSEVIFQDIATPGFTPLPGDSFAFSARTGGATQTTLIDDLVIETPPTERDPAFASSSTGLVFNPLTPSSTSEGSLTVTNEGSTADLVIDSATLSGPDAASFNLVSTLPLTVPPGETAELVVEATAGGESGALSAYLDLTTNDSVMTFQNVTVPVQANVLTDGETASYVQNFDDAEDGATDFGDGSTLQTTNAESALATDGALQLTADTIVSQTYFYLPSLGAPATQSFEASFDFTLEATETPADGFSFNYGSIQPGQIGFEEGFGKGISVEFDTYNNLAGEAGYNVAVDGIDVAGGFVSGMPPVDAVTRTANITWYRTGPATGLLSLVIGEDIIFDDVSTEGFHPTANDIFAFAARSGGSSETLLLDNIDIQAPAADRDPLIVVNDRVDFGSVDQGETREVAVMIENAGATSDLEVSADSSIAGDDASAFSLVTPLPLTIAPGASEELTLSVAAGTDVGPLSAQLLLVSNDAQERAQEKSVELAASVAVSGGTYEQDFDSFADGTTEFGDGSTLVRNDETAQVTDGALLLTQDTVGSTVTHFFMPPLGSAASESFTVEFDYLLESSATPADGFSFNYGPFSITDSGSEEGFGVGLSVEFDTYNNGAGEAGHNVAVNNVDVPGGFNPEVPFADGETHSVEISWIRSGLDSGRVTVRVDGEIMFNELPTEGFVPSPNDIFGFVARTGGSSETVIVDNILLQAPSDAFDRDPYIVTQGAIDFGSIQQGDTVEMPLTIMNEGGTNSLEISADSSVTGEGFAIVSDLPITIPPNDSVDLIVSATAGQNLGVITGALTLANNDSDEAARERVVNLTATVTPESGSYTQDFDGFSDGTRDFADGSSVTTNNEEVTGVFGGAFRLIQDEVTGTTASYILPSLGEATTDIFIASFDLTLEALGSPADGFALTYGDIPASGLPPQEAEEGWGNGLSIEFDSYPADDPESGYNIAVNNVDVPNGHIDENLLVDGETRAIEILWIRSGVSGGQITVTMDGEPLFSELPTPGFNPQPDYRFAFAGRTGGSTMSVLLDNLSVVGGTDDPNLLIGSASFGVISDASPVTRTLTVRNTGSENTLNISAATVEPSDVFSVVSFPESIEPSGQGEIVVEIDPTVGDGLETATLNLQSDDESQSTVSVSLRASFPLSPDLLAFFQMDETAGTQMQDASGNGRNGTYVGAIELGQSALATGSSVRFGAGGELGYAQVPSFPPLQEISIGMWIEREAASDIAGLFSKRDSVGTGSPYNLSVFDNLTGTGPGTLVWTVGEDPNVPQLVGDSAITLNTTHHIVITHRDDNGAEAGANLTRLFVDGELLVETADPLGFVDEEGVLEIGRVGEDIGFNGLIDDVQIYGRELTGEEVAQLFAEPGSVIGVETPVEPVDSDGDGMTDEEEAIAGTDPNDPMDYLRGLSTERTESGVQFTWSSKEGITYDVEYSPSMEPGTWTVISTVEGGADSSSFMDEDETRTGTSEGFYRATVVPAAG